MIRTWKNSGENLSVLVLIPPSPQNTNVIRDVLYGSWCGGKLVGGGMMPPLSSLYVATVLAADKNPTTLIDCSAEQRDLKSLLELAPRFNILVLQTSSITIDEDAETARALRSRNPDLVTIFYGSHPTFMPESTLDKDGVDLIACREPEFIIRDLVRA
ncbi:MAG: cobalamin-dependent protein, partial [Proteobacteria bacterium]|nr:cobalamin-dependent protein [Pseudomonadota bacterium]